MKYLFNVIRILFLVLFVFLLQKNKMMVWLAIYGVSLIVALVFGRLYCGYICPMNTLMIPTAWISKKLKIQTDKIPKWLSTGVFAWIALIASIGIMIFGKRILHKNIPVLIIWLIVSVLITLRYQPLVFHNLICPFGPLQKIFGRFAIFSKRVNKEGCIGCKLCQPVCPTTAIVVKEDKKAEITTSLCLQCNSCQDICPKKTIPYRNKIG